MNNPCDHSWAGMGPDFACELPSEEDPDVSRVFHECVGGLGHVGRGADLHECACNATTSHQGYLDSRNREQERYAAAVQREAQLNLFLQVMSWKPGDYGWRDRPPTPEELKAHDTELLHGVWVCMHTWRDGEPDGFVEVLEWRGYWFCPNSGHTRNEPDGRWRPLTREYWPAPWPEVTP